MSNFTKSLAFVYFWVLFSRSSLPTIGVSYYDARQLIACATSSRRNWPNTWQLARA